MSVLIVGAGAAGGYLGSQLVAGARPVTFLVRQRTLGRLASDGLRTRQGSEVRIQQVDAVSAAGLDGRYDVIVVAVRTDAVESAIDDIRDVVGARTLIVPIMNGMRHLALLSTAFGQDRVLGAATRLVASLLSDGTVEVVAPGIEMEIGHLDGSGSKSLDRTVAELDVANIDVCARGDVVAAMWEKFAFIASTAVLTCLMGEEIGPIAGADGGIDLGHQVLAEVASVAAAEGFPLAEGVHAGLDTLLTDPSSTFGPSMYRDMSARRPIEVAVLGDLAERARRHRISTPLLDASMVEIAVHNRRVAAAVARAGS